MASQPRALEYFDKILQLDKSKIHEEDGELIIAAVDVHRAMWAFYNKTKFYNYTQCTKCQKWRVNPENKIAPEDDWFCSMITIDGKPGSCEMPSNVKVRGLEEFSPGEIVWAKCSHYPWWPAIVEDCPSQANYCRIQKQWEEYHVVFFGKEPSRSWLKRDYIVCYEKSTHERFSRCPKQYVKELQLAIQDAEEARKLSYLDRMEKFSFLIRWKDEIPNYVFKLDEDIGNVLHIPFLLKKEDSGVPRSQKTKSVVKKELNESTDYNKATNSSNDKETQISALELVVKKELNESTNNNKATNSNIIKRNNDGESQTSVPEPVVEKKLNASTDNNKAANAIVKKELNESIDNNKATNSRMPRSQNTKSVVKKEFNDSTHNNKATNSNNLKNNDGESQTSDPKPGIPRSQSSKSETTTVSSKRQRNKNEYSAQKQAKIRRKEKVVVREFIESTDNNEASSSSKKDADFSTSEDEWLSSASLELNPVRRRFLRVILRETASVSQRGILERATPDKRDINYLSYASLRVSSKKC
ncbi:zinc finger CW-type PWWP domain protein 1 [Caerostris darwini]|uniref:Zinc finger CW-type PWWP domain protein 1 n=1 Tax=Caerostris darwini TaxID=1538125 RepID=A0AAV4VPA9_9ARAC|nr:zinc finger CW-type PWWP domain protein 1 [Caerostris darwini]